MCSVCLTPLYRRSPACKHSRLPFSGLRGVKRTTLGAKYPEGRETTVGDKMAGKREVVVLDGGTGKSLVAMGYPEVDNNPLWSALLVRTKPEAIVQLHKQFYESGADVVVSATYQASIEGYAKRFDLKQAEAAQLVTEGVKLAKQAADEMHMKTGKKYWVAGSVGPYGATLCDMSEYHGKYAEKMTSNELLEWHKVRLAAILEGKPDLLAVETIPVQKEAEAILEALKSFPQCCAWISFQCKDGLHTGHGERLSEAVRSSLNHNSVIAVGVNCTSTSHITPLLQSLAPLEVKIPVLVKPNRGMDFSSTEKSDMPLESHAREWIEHGASWLGGCCNFEPQDIVGLRQFLESQPDLCLPGLKL